MKDNETQRMLEDIELHGRDLTEWEENFVKSVRKQFDRKGTLSDRQIEILERIYAEKTPTGTSFGGQKFTTESVSELPSERLKNRSRRYD